MNNTSNNMLKSYLRIDGVDNESKNNYHFNHNESAWL